MRKSGFTLIELVFVIVILGILAAVAVPRLAGVQDDAVIASEQTGIASVRTGIQTVKGKIILGSSNPASATVLFNTVVTADTGTSYTLPFLKTDAQGSSPKVLNLATGYVTMGAVASDASDLTLALVLEPGSRKSWTTVAGAVATDTKITGPASKTITDTTAAISTTSYWTYFPANGNVIFTK